MVSLKQIPVTTMLVAGMLLLAGGVMAAEITAALGDEIELKGYATSGPFVYLFLTGPNLPVNGVSLHDVSKRSDQGGFTKVSVDGDDRWEYTWHTGSIRGRLDEGTYTIWIVSGPHDRSTLSSADFRTLSVTLGKPGIWVDTPVQPGGMTLQSVPDGASLMIGGEYRGKTPLTIHDLLPGDYAVTFSRFGYGEQSVLVPVEGGKTAEVRAVLQKRTGTLVVNSTPSNARVLLDGSRIGFSPVVLRNISADNHTLLLEKDGYTPVSRQVTINGGQVSSVELSLEPFSVTTPRAASHGLALAGAFCVICLGIACSRCRDP